MTSAETGEQWRKRGVHSLFGREPRAWLQIGDEPEHESEIVGPEWLVDRIIADHKAAAALREPVEVVPVGSTDHLEWRLQEADKAAAVVGLLLDALREIATMAERRGRGLQNHPEASEYAEIATIAEAAIAEAEAL